MTQACLRPAEAKSFENRPQSSGPAFRIISLGASIAFLSFVDRAAISQAAPVIMRDLHLSTVQMGLVFSAFGVTYAAGEIPSGWFADRFGERALLTRVVVLWSLFTAMTGWAWSFRSLVGVRLLFGAGESGCFPGLARMFKTWLTPSQRNAAEGIKAASARLGAAITPALLVALLGIFSWRLVFLLLGFIGFLWTAIFRFSYRESAPRSEAGSGPISWQKLMRSRSAWALGIQWFCHYYGFYFYITWLPIYLLKTRGLDLRHEALAASLPLIGAALGSFLSGFLLTQLIQRTNDTRRSRKLFGYAAYGGASILLAIFPSLHTLSIAIVVLSLSSFAAEFSSPISWTTAMDLGQKHVGSVSGFMNMLGHLGGSVAPTLTALVLSITHNDWPVAFYVSATIYAFGTICWFVMDPATPLDLEYISTP
jgi:MFS family permease